MAPESERANVKHTDECSAQALTTCKCGALQRALREQNEQIAKQYGIDLNNLPELPNEPTLTCSEVVERLEKECLRWKFQDEFDSAKATEILHSWRERRVQELENLLAKHSLSPEPQSTQLDTTTEKI